MATGGFLGCVIVWERYPHELRGEFKDGIERGLVTCHTHDWPVDMAVPRDAEWPDSCPKAEEDEDE